MVNPRTIRQRLGHASRRVSRRSSWVNPLVDLGHPEVSGRFKLGTRKPSLVSPNFKLQLPARQVDVTDYLRSTGRDPKRGKQSANG